MERDEVWRAIDSERASLADLLEELGPEEWEAPSLCAGWRVRDVAAHLTLAQMGVFGATVGLVRARGSMNGMIRDTARRRAALPVATYAPALRAMLGSRRRAPGVGDLEPLLDVLVHGQDIVVPLRRSRPVPPVAAAAAAGRAWERGWPWYPRRRLHGLRLVADDVDWSVGRGAEVRGPVRALLLAVTGRPAGLGDLSGEGVAELGSRLS